MKTSQVETELSHIDLWLKNNKMTINTDKTETIFFGNHSQLKKVENKTVNYMGIPLKRSEKVKYLGVIFDQKMQWEDHIKNLNQNILFKYKSHWIASSLTPNTKKLLINALVMPYLNYCSSAWASATQGRLGKLEKRLKNVYSFLEKDMPQGCKNFPLLTYLLIQGCGCLSYIYIVRCSYYMS